LDVVAISLALPLSNWASPLLRQRLHLLGVGDAGRRDAARNVAKRYADAFPDGTEVQALVRSLN